jgi:hypothetical protein
VSTRTAPIALVAAVLGAGAFAIFHSDPAPAADPVPVATAAARGHDVRANDTPSPAPEGLGEVDPNSPLPPNHPSIDTMGMGGAPAAMGGAPAATHGAAVAANPDDAPNVVWTAPAVWAVAPNPSTMRLATYKVAGPGGEAELSVARAGGSVDANIERWIGQFEQAGKDTRTEKTLRGMKITIVDVSGTYLGGMSGAPGSHPGWSLLAAIVEGKGDPYFFKLTGPTSTVRAARSAFDGMIGGLTAK